MRLLSARVTHYKTILDSHEVNMDQVTCLVGKNESGKTAFLQALAKARPVAGAPSKFDRLMEYPRRHHDEYDSRHGEEDPRVIECEFLLSDDDVNRVESQFGPGSVHSKRLTISKGYDDIAYFDIDVDEKAVVSYVVERIIEDSGERMFSTAGISTIDELIESLRDAPSDTDPN